MIKKKFTIDQIPGIFESRVFVGGNYDSMPVLREIESHIAKQAFAPILAIDCKMSDARIHDDTLLLLHSCRYAIFEVTRPSGELMELERVRDYGNKVLVVYQVKSEAETFSLPGQISKMLTGVQAIRTGYHSFDSLKRSIERFLIPNLLAGEHFPFVAIKGILGRDATDEEIKLYSTALNSSQINEYGILSMILESDEYKNLDPDAKTNSSYIKSVYFNLLSQIPENQEIAPSLALLEKHLTTKQQLFIDFLNSDIFCNKLKDVINADNS